jgi:glycosyltransferase involved in cell wall biosynthesis
VALIGAFGSTFRHSIISMDGRTTAADRLPPGADVRLLPAPPRGGSLATARRLRQVLRAEQPDLVLTYNWGAFDMLLAAGSLGYHRLIHHEEGFNQDEAQSFKLRRVLARRLVLPTAHCLVVPSQRLERIAQEVWKIPAARVRCIPNGIRLDAFTPALPEDTAPELRDRLGIPRDAVVAGSVGSLRPVKNYLRLLEAAARASARTSSGVHVLLVGDGEERAALEARAAAPELAGRVHFAGYQADPAPYLRAMDIFSLTSDSEQMPVSLLEAMASGLPAVATDVGDVRIMLPPEQGDLLVPVGPEAGLSAAGALAARLSALATDPDRRRRLGEANRRRVEERFSFAGMCQAYLEVYHSALLSGGGKTPVLRSVPH